MTRLLLAVLLLAACSDSTDPPDDPNPPPPPPPPEAADIVIAAAQTISSGPPLEVRLELRNDGGPGVYVVDLYSLPTLGSPAGEFYGRSEAVEVDEDYAEAVSYIVDGETTPIGRAEVFSRDEGSALYRLTDSHDFPPP